MKIKDVERSTGLSQSNIRFYEEEGLIIPVRLENNYRDYSKDDVERLLNIKKLRILGIPVAEIREVLEERQTLENCLQNRLEEIEREKQSLNEIAAVCKDAIERHVGFDSINEISFDEDSEECRDILQHILVNDTYEEVVDDAAFRRVAIGVYFAGIIISAGPLWVSLAESAVMTAAGLAVMMIACGAKDTAFLLAAGSVGWVYFFGTMMIWNLASSRDFRFNACFALRTATDMLNIMGVVFDLRGRYGSYNMRRTPEDDKKYYAG